MNILVPFLLITGLFFLFLTLKSIFFAKKQFCVICSAVVMTWIIFLVLYWQNLFDQPILLALLMGQSILGMFYYLDKNVPEHMTVFRLPFLLTMTIVAYMVITKQIVFSVTLFMFGLWGLFFLVFMYRKEEKLQRIVKKLVECCKQW